MTDGKNKVFYTANEVAVILGISITSAYRIIRSLNDELNSKDFITIRGKISVRYFNERMYQ